MKILDGRDFSRDFAADTARFIINEQAKKYLGFEEPVGHYFLSDSNRIEIIGVVNDFHSLPLTYKIEPLILNIWPEFYTLALIRILPGNLQEAIDHIEKIWNKVVPGFPFEYNFVDESIDQMYRTEERLGNLLKYFTILAIIIACLGLFGLASFTAEQRTQEIGIRKVMGARVSTVMLLLSREFTWLVVISCLIAIPAALIVMKKVFLQNFEYRTDVAWWIFLGASLAALLIAILTVSYQAARAALSNPADALRYE